LGAHLQERAFAIEPSVVALTVGDRALQARSTMSFIVENEITIVGMFSQNGFQTVKIGAPVDIVFDNAPGRIYHAKITGIPKGVGQGQIAVSGTLARTNAIGGTSVFPAEISVPDEMSRESLRLGMSGNATAFAENAGRAAYPGENPAVGSRIAASAWR
jgi:multidrug resistance efflux pump